MAIDTKIKNYPASHGKNNGSGGGGTTIIMGGGVGNTSIPSDINVNSINANIGDISILKGKSLSFNDGQFIYLGSSNGTVNKISGDNLKYAYGDFGEIKADKVGTKELTTEDLNAVKGWIGTLNSKSITTEYLNVTRQAHFFELVIDKIRSVGGQMIMTAANCVVDYAKAVDANGNYLENLDDSNAKAYDIFWLGSDASGRSVTNDWKVNDQAICQSFNNVSTGVNYDVSNKYYWRLVTEILPDRYMNLSSGAELSLDESQQATVNAVTITAPYLADINDTRLDTGWNTQAQQISGVITGASWTETSGGADEQTVGTMTTTNTVFGIQITPVKGSTTEIVNANYFGFSCTPARLNVGIYYTDGTSQYFVAPDKLQTSYRYETLTQAPVEAIVITNAEEVEWKVVHGIRLSNTDYASMIDGYTSIPSIGDNVIQLGYRYGDNNEDKSRSSAIIIAAYNTPDSELTPPSYAQYTNITDYELSKHRQTYIDAKGSKFVGNFYVDANTSIQDIIDQTAHTTYHLHIAYANSADGQTDFTKIPLTDVSYSYMGYCSNTDASDESLTYADYQWVLVPGGAGTNGGHWEYAYKNSADQPTAPAPGTTIDQLTDGWATTGTTPDFENGEYTWMSQCYVSGATGQYGTWTNPIRITGENGKAGEDGKYTEFIYRQFDKKQSWDNNYYDPAKWEISNVPDYTGDPKYGWSDNPNGVSENIKFEYVSTREFNGTTFTKFETPVIWSKWGEKGQDGDGYEYIYKVFPEEKTWLNDDENPEYWDANQTDDYLGPTGYKWSDDPQSVTSSNKFQYCAVRKKKNGVWDKFSIPTIWGTYGVGEPGPQGITGPQGPIGPQGDSTQVYRLIDNGSQAYVKMDLDKNTNDIVEQLVISLNYKVAKFVGGTVTFMTYDELLNFPKEFGSTNGLYAYVKHYNPNDSPVVQWHRLTLNNDGTFTYSFASTNSNAIENNATIEVRLIPYKASSIVTSSSGLNYTKDSVFVPITLLPKATLNVVQGHQASIRALVTGQEDNKKLITDVQITAAGIQSTVAEHETKITNAQNAITETNNKVAKIEQTASGIQSTVEDHTSKILKNTNDITNANNAISDANNAISDANDAINANTNAINANTNAITVTTNKVSEIEQTAGRIQTTVSSMTKYSEGCNLLTGSNLDGKDTKLYFTCDKYSHLCMLPVNGWPHNSFYCDVETTTKAVYYGLRWGGYGRENIILEVGKEYTASVWVYGHGKISMEIQYYDTINDDYRNGYTDSHGFIIEENQGWQQISFNFTAKPYNEYENSTVQYDSSTVHYAEVFYLLYNTEDGKNKVRGGQVYFSCPMLAPKGTLNWQFAKNEIKHKTKNILDGTLDFNIGGNLRIVNADEIGDYDNDIVASSKYISGTSKSSDRLELAQWEIDSADLKGNTDYTLSFYARSTSSNELLNVYIYYPDSGPSNLMEDSQGNTNIYNGDFDGYTQIKLDSTWAHYWVHWHLKDNFIIPKTGTEANKILLLLRLPEGNNNAQIALPKLELGAAATGYDEGGDMLSRITQTASNINASIVDLTTGLETVGINLNGINSTITMKGNVEIRPPETAKGGEAEYLKVYDTAGIERVIVESGNIPTISDLSNKLSGLQTYSLAAPTFKEFNYNTITKKHVWTGTVEGTMEIGYIPEGTTMTLNAADTLYQSSFNNVIIEKSTGHTLTLNILKDGASVYSKTLTHSVGGTNTNTASYAMTNGTFSIRITESGTITITGLNRPGGIVSQPNLTQNEGTFGVVGWTVKMKMQAEKPSFTQIGQNGMVLASAFNKYLYYDNSKFAIRNGKEGIILDDNGLHRICLLKDVENEALMTCGFNKRNVYTYSGSGTLTLDSQHYNNYDLFVFTYSGPAKLSLSANTNTSGSNPWPCIGHTIQVKKINSGDLTITSSDRGSSKALILSLDGSDLSSSYNCGHTCTTLTWTGNYWVTSR